jgi:hypothetical protein
MSCKIKKENQLGMNPSTASGRLVKDILYSLVVQTNKDNCHHCGKKINREDFSIEHKVPWLDSEDPQYLFFDLSNIAFSHLKCNTSAARTRPLAPCGTQSAYQRGCRCVHCIGATTIRSRQVYTTEKRRERYLRNGK